MERISEVGTNSRKLAVAGLVAALMVLAVVALNGFTVREARTHCSTVKTTCHGLPANDCIGQEKTETEFIEKNQCDLVENITSECRSLKQRICNSEKVSSQDWRQTAVSFGKSCAAWDRQYDLGFSPC